MVGSLARFRLALSMLALWLASGCQNAASRQQARVFIEGEGPPLVMLGGGVAGAAGFAPHSRELAGDYRVIRLESVRMERAQSGQRLPADYSIRMESRAVVRALDRLGVSEPVHIVGHSFGALVALDVALEQPGRVRSLVLAEPPAFWVVATEERASDGQMRAMIELTRSLRPDVEPTDGQLAEFQRLLGRPGTRPAEGEAGWGEWVARRRAIRGLSAVADHDDDARRLGGLDRPVLIVTGARTVAFHRRINDVLAQQLAKAQRVELDGGHGVPTAAPGAFVRAVREFLARQ